MKGNDKKNKRSFCSMSEYEREYFSSAHARRLAENSNGECGLVGTGLAAKLLDSIKQSASQDNDD